MFILERKKTIKKTNVSATTTKLASSFDLVLETGHEHFRRCHRHLQNKVSVVAAAAAAAAVATMEKKSSRTILIFYFWFDYGSVTTTVLFQNFYNTNNNSISTLNSK